MEVPSFDFDVFPIAVASRLLGFHTLQEHFTNASDEMHWYWRSPPSEKDTQCIWMDSSWEIERGNKTVWKLGCLWKNSTGNGGVYVQSDELHESDFREFFNKNLSIDLGSSPTIVLAKSFAQALQNSQQSSDEGHTDCKSMHLSFSDLETTATFPLVTGTTGTRTDVGPVILSRLQYTCPPVTADPCSLSSEELVRMYQTWKSQFASSKKQHVVSPPIADEKHVPETLESSTLSKKRTAKRSRVHGYSKVPSLSHRRPGLKFKEQN